MPLASFTKRWLFPRKGRFCNQKFTINGKISGSSTHGFCTNLFSDLVIIKSRVWSLLCVATLVCCVKSNELRIWLNLKPGWLFWSSTWQLKSPAKTSSKQPRFGDGSSNRVVKLTIKDLISQLVYLWRRLDDIIRSYGAISRAISAKCPYVQKTQTSLVYL